MCLLLVWGKQEDGKWLLTLSNDQLKLNVSSLLFDHFVDLVYRILGWIRGTSTDMFGGGFFVAVPTTLAFIRQH